MHDPETHLIPLVAIGSDGAPPSIGIFGDDYPTPMELAFATTCM
jgi:UDP-glucose 4-epimerase